MPSFFLHEYNLNLKQSALFASGVLLAGVVGDTVGGVISDRIIRRTGSTRRARVGVIVTGSARSSSCCRCCSFTISS